jgi:hypothetical protein
MPTGTFDASQFQSSQAVALHPVGDFEFQISNTEIKPTKDNSGGYFQVEFTSPQGSIIQRYNIWNNEPKAVEIAHGQLSALCHAVGVFRINWQTQGAELRGARGKMRVGYQKGEEPTADKPQGGYVELKKVMDINGNEPGRAPAPAAQPQAAPPNGGGWGQAAAPANQPQQGAQPWQPGPSNQQTAQPHTGWQQGTAAPNPPWGGRSPWPGGPAAGRPG